MVRAFPSPLGASRRAKPGSGRLSQRLGRREATLGDGSHTVPLEEDLRAFVGLASEWEDVPNQRDAYEREIVVAADRFRARWGR